MPLLTQCRLFFIKINSYNTSKTCSSPKIFYDRLKQFRSFHRTALLKKIVSFNLSDIGEGIRDVTIKEWFVKVGDNVQQFDNLCEVQSDKASVTITSRYDGKITKLYHQIEDTAYVGKPLIDFDVSDDSDSDSSESENEKEKPIEMAVQQNPEFTNQNRAKFITTPAVRRIAMENKVDLKKILPTGKNGRILKGDILQYLGLIPETGSQNVKSSKPDNFIEPLKGIKKAMFKSMSESLKVPHFAYSDEVNMTNLIIFRDQLKVDAEQRGVSKLTFMPFCIKAASLALLKYPILNSSLDMENEAIIYKKSHNISVAMDTTQGLVVPNVKDCQNKSILEIAKDLGILIEKGRNGNLAPTDFLEGTFSLSNIGVIGGTYTHPCIMVPQVSIGAMGKVQILPRFDLSGEIRKAHIMNVSWCADHRIIDGVTMAKFSNLWKRYLENPALFLLDEK